MTAPVPIEVALNDPMLLGRRFGDCSSWKTWFVVLKAAYGRPLSKSERADFDRVAGGRLLSICRQRGIRPFGGSTIRDVRAPVRFTDKNTPL